MNLVCKRGHLKTNKNTYKNGWCKDCSKERQNTEEQKKRQFNSSRNWYLKKTFGINNIEYERMLNKQNRCCAICKKHESNFPKKLAVDHNHVTGKVRGLLCISCNTQVLPTIENYPHLISTAQNYLQEFSLEFN